MLHSRIMLSLQQFTALAYAQKKSTLIDLCTQITTPKVSFDDIIFLLQASNAIQEATLVIIYKSFEGVVGTAKELSLTNEELVNMKKIVQHDIASQWDTQEADKLLDTI